MLTETLHITVTLNGRKFRRTVQVTSDGSFHAVNEAVSQIVRKDWIGQSVTWSWSY